jgi:NAD(P)-dependent dehydrogenase (short-subunit alcohol dehydrogenase family)
MDHETLLITGAASGIGEAAAQRMAKKMRVVLADLNFSGAAAVAEELNSRGSVACAVEVDVRNRDSVHRMTDWIATHVGPIHALFNNAGVRRTQSVEKISEADWDLMMHTHVKGAFLCSQAVLPQMCERKRGAIVNMSSDLAVTGAAGMGAYAAAMSAVYSLTKTLAREFAPFGIRVNALGPGPIDTPLLRSGWSDREWKDAEAEILRRVPMGRLGRPEEIAPVLEFLLSDRSAYITGQLIQPNGGAVSW